MMEQIINWILLLVFISSVNLSYSAVFFHFEHRVPEKDYRNSRSTSVHRGLILSLSSAKRIEMCKDLFSLYYTKKTVLPDKEENIDELPVVSYNLENISESNPAIIVGKISHFTNSHMVLNRIDDIFFQCSAKNFNIEYAYDVEYFVSSTFQRGLMYVALEDDVLERAVSIIVYKYSGMSPEYVSLEQTELEKQYIASRRTIEALKKESPEYVNMIEKRDNLSQLSVWQKFLLCSSIILSPTHEKDRHKFHLYWGHYEMNAKTGNHQYKSNQVKFIANNNHGEDKWWTDSLYCRSSAKSVYNPSHRSTNLLLTRSYNDKYSLYVLIEEKGVTRIKEYVKNAPLLINTLVPFTNDPEYVAKYVY